MAQSNFSNQRPPPLKKRPNIILCVADQLRPFEMGCYGQAGISTPNLDRLAADGVRFETAVSNFPVCMAARSVLLSGQSNRTCTGGVSNVSFSSLPSRPGLPDPFDKFNMPEYPYPNRPHLPQPTLAELLRDSGYRTAAIGKWHVHSWPDDVGFDNYLIPRVHHCHVGQSFVGNTENGGQEFVPPGFSVDFEAQRVGEFFQQAQAKAQAQAQDKNPPEPFFLYYNISPPHCPFADLPEKYLAMYRPGDVALRPNVNPDKQLERQDHWFKVYRYDFRYYSLHLPYTRTLPEGYSLRHLIAEYWGATTCVDDTVGRMLAALEAAGLADNTIVIFTADHGDNLGSHGLVQKGGPNEESARIPLLVRWPGGLGSGRVVRGHVASLVDVAPTIMDVIGGKPPEHWHGQSLAPLLRGDSRRPGISEINSAIIETSDGVGVRSPSCLYYLPFDKTKARAKTRKLARQPSQFYDLAADPYQLHNLADTDAAGQTRQELHERLMEWDRDTPWMP